MGIYFYWKSNYGDPRIEKMLRESPAERQTVWGVDCGENGCAFTGIGKIRSLSHNRTHASLVEGMVARCWRFDKFYGRFDAEEFTWPTLVIRQWMKDLAESGKYSDLEEAVLEFATENDHPNDWQLIDGLGDAFLRRIVGDHPSFEEKVCFDYHRFMVFRNFLSDNRRVQIVLVEDILREVWWTELAKRINAAQKCKPLRVKADEFSIPGTGEKNYQVKISTMTCDCEDFTFRGRIRGMHCKHLISALQAARVWERWENSIPKSKQGQVSC